MAQLKSNQNSTSTARLASGMTVFRALPKTEGKRPAVILLHERYGVDQHTKDLTLKLSQAGYVGLAPDLFSRFTGDRKALQQGAVRVELRDNEVLKDLAEAIDYLKKLSAVDGSKIAIINLYCLPRTGMIFPLPWCFMGPWAEGSGRRTSSGRSRWSI